MSSKDSANGCSVPGYSTGAGRAAANLGAEAADGERSVAGPGQGRKAEAGRLRQGGPTGRGRAHLPGSHFPPVSHALVLRKQLGKVGV